MKPKYLPKEIKFEEIRIYGDSKVRLIFSNDDNSKTMRFEQEIISGGISTVTLLDTEGPIISKDIINGYEVTICNKVQEQINETWLLGMWSDDEMLYTINTNIDEDALIKIIKNLE